MKRYYSVIRGLALLTGVPCLAACSPIVGICDEVAGSCMDLIVGGNGSYSSLEVSLGKTSESIALITSDGTGKLPTVPYHVRLVPPVGIRSGQLGWLSARAVNASGALLSTRLNNLYWPDGSHVVYVLNF